MVTKALRGDWQILYNPTRNPIELSPLSGVGWLAQQPREFMDWAAQSGRWRMYSAGQFVYHAGDVSDGIYGLASGGLQITFPLLAQEPVIIHRAEIGFWIGDLGELAATPRMISVMAASESRLFYIPSNAIAQLLQAQPKYWQSFYRLSAINSFTAITLLSEVLALTVRARVCRRLLALSAASPTIEITQEELAQMLGITRPTLRRCLSDLEQRGGLSSSYGVLRVVSRLVLEEFRDEQ